MTKVRQKIISAVLACSMLLCSSPGVTDSLLQAKALLGNGGGNAGNYADGEGTYDGIKDLGLRIYVYNPTTGEIVKNSSGKQLIKDVVYESGSTGMRKKAESYGASKYNSTRLGVVEGDIEWSYSTYLNTVVKTKAYGGTSGGGSLNVTGDIFYNWMMVHEGTTDRWMQSTYKNAPGEFKYNGIRLISELFGLSEMASINSDCYIIVEPLVLMGNTFIDSWSGWMIGAINGDFDNCYNDAPNGAKIGNGFQLTEKDTVLNLMPPAVQLTNYKGLSALEYLCPDDGNFTAETLIGTADIPGQGWGIQTYSLAGIVNSDDPINTYDIHNNPTEPDKPETPGESNPNPKYPDDSSKNLQNTGDVDIVKVYAKAYKDVNGGYTHVDPVGVYTETKASNHIIITDESEKNGGYKVVAWDTSTVKRFRPLIFLR